MTKKRFRRGFTLTEVVFAATLMAGALSVFLATITYSAKASYSAKNQTVAMNFARVTIETHRQFGFSDPRLAAGTRVSTGSQYLARITVSAISTNAKAVTVEIPWTNLVSRSVSTAAFSTVICSALH